MGLRRAAVLAGMWLVGYGAAVALLPAGSTAELLVSDGLYLLPIALAVFLAFDTARRLPDGRKWIWLLLGTGAALWLAGEVVWSFEHAVRGRDVPYPGVPDVFFLAGYVPELIAVVWPFGAASGLRRARAVLDAGVAGAAVGLLGCRLLISAADMAGHTFSTAVSVAYAGGDVAVLVTLLSLGFGLNRRIPGSVVLFGGAFVVGALADTIFLGIDYAGGSLIEVLWQAQALLLCLAALAARRPQEHEGRLEQSRRDLGFIPALVAGACIAGLLLLDAQSGRLSASVLVLGIAQFGGLFARQWLTVRDKDQVARRLDGALKEQERLAQTDELTGLYNRRHFEEILREETGRSGRTGEPLSVLVVDLDHFKRINDTHGHEAGDEVLRQAAQRVPSTLRAADTVARYGGEEFVVLLPGADVELLADIAERIRLAIREQPFVLPDPFGKAVTVRVTVSLGGATHPYHAERSTDLVRTADRALYAAKARGRDQVCVGEVSQRDLLPEVDGGVLMVLERMADLIDARQSPHEHSAAMSRWAAVLGARLGLCPVGCERVQLAARLHDLGKMAVPDAVLLNPDPLDEAEWALLRDHSEAGARLLEDLPGLEAVAALVRTHHERPDGRGYPRGLAGGEVAVDTGILAVCDAWAAMRAERCYGPVRSREEARAELAAGRGTQFDAAVVDAFLELEASGQIGDLDVVAPRPAPV